MHLPMMKRADLQRPVEAREAGRPRWSTAATAMPSSSPASSGSEPELEAIVAGGCGACGGLFIPEGQLPTTDLENQDCRNLALAAKRLIVSTLQRSDLAAKADVPHVPGDLESLIMQRLP
jgi:hypothetical protein